MRAHWKPIATLLLLTPCLTELLSGNMPASVFFQPHIYLFLATVGYGFPVLLLREFAVRWQIGLAGMFCLGLVYGIFNEGIIAKTFYMAAHVPINTYDGYGYHFGICIPWALTISTWHSLHAFIYPVAAVCFFFPKHAQAPWLNSMTMVLLAIPSALIGSLIYFHPNKNHAAGDGLHFTLMVLISALLIVLSMSLRSRPALGQTGALHARAFFVGGLAFLAFLFVPVLLASVKIPETAFYAYIVLAIVLMLSLIRRHISLPINNVLLFAIGDDTLLALFGLVPAVAAHSLQRLLTNFLFVAVFVWLWWRVQRTARLAMPTA
jgi:hypothetical protein